jgi:hypothetical protein
MKTIWILLSVSFVVLIAALTVSVMIDVAMIRQFDEWQTSEPQVIMAGPEEVITSNIPEWRPEFVEVLLRSNPKLPMFLADLYASYAEEAIRNFATVHPVDPLTVAKIIVKESHGYPLAANSYEANGQRFSTRGLMGVSTIHESGLVAAGILRTGENGKVAMRDYHDPKTNIMAGTYILACKLKQADGNLDRALYAYSGGAYGGGR